MVITDIRDSVADRYLGIQLANNVAEAIRSFEITVETLSESKDSILGARPCDFDLYVLGQYDTNTGIIDAVEPECICTGKRVVWKLENRDEQQEG